jgi:hypothetical protein
MVFLKALLQIQSISLQFKGNYLAYILLEEINYKKFRRTKPVSVSPILNYRR